MSPTETLMYCDRIRIRNERGELLLPTLLSFTPSKLANSCFVSSSAILILLLVCEHQASSFGFEGMLSIEQTIQVNDNN